MNTANVEVTVLGGLLIEVEYEVEAADPAVGINVPYVADWRIVGVAGKRKKNTDWILNRLSRKQQDEVTQACEADAKGW